VTRNSAASELYEKHFSSGARMVDATEFDQFEAVRLVDSIEEGRR